MYKRNAQGWSKHLDFFIIDEIVLHVAFIIATLIRMNIIPYTTAEYRSLAIVLFLSDALVQMLFNTMHNVIKRGPLRELWETCNHCVMVFFGATAYLFAGQTGESYSLLVLMYTLGFHIVIGYLTRLSWKQILSSVGTPLRNKITMIAVLNPKYAESTLQSL